MFLFLKKKAKKAKLEEDTPMAEAEGEEKKAKKAKKAKKEKKDKE